MKLHVTLNVLRAIVVLSIVGLLVQTYDFVMQLSSMEISLQAFPTLFESWFFGASSLYLNIYPAWYPLALIALAMIGLRFRYVTD